MPKIEHLSGRNTDTSDPEWIADLFEKFYLSSRIFPRGRRELRSLAWTRERARLK
jgi:hypothetical protein